MLRAWGLRLRVERVHYLALLAGLSLRVEGVGFKATGEGVGFEACGEVLRVWGLVLGVWGLRPRVESLRLRDGRDLGFRD